ncbi:MAG: PQQ-dependent sugar dehydrogenase [Planctomycetota bacterium]
MNKSPNTRAPIVRASVMTAVAALTASTVTAQPITGDVPLSSDAPQATGYTLETVVDGLDHPWGVCWLSESEMLVTERSGRVRLVRDGELLREPVATVPGVLEHGQGGLMDISLHPEFANNGFVYLTYATGTKARNQTVLGRAVYTPDAEGPGRLTRFEVLFRPNVWKSGGQHFGSRVLWLPGGTLLLTIGDGGNPPVRYRGEWIREQAQNPRTHNGSVLHLTDEGDPAEPDGHVEGGAAELYSFGHRNIQGIARDPATGDLWANEHGANGGDELNLLQPGGNFGWPVATYSREYFGPRITDQTSAEGMIDPLVVWTPCKAPSGLALYDGDAFPQWKGDLFSGALRGKHVRRIDLEDGRIVGQEIIPADARVRDVRQGPDGLLYYLTDESDGAVVRVIPE